MFTLQLKATAPQLSAGQFNFLDNNNGEICVMETAREPAQTVGRPSAPMPECCLAQNRNFNAIINTANITAPTFTDSIISSSADLNFENNSTHNTSRFIHPPPALLALASTVIRE